MPHLAVNTADGFLARPLKSPITAGGAPSDGIRLTSPLAKRHHFKIDSDAGGWYVEDLLESWTVCVNGVPVLKRYLCDGDEIELGEDSIVFHDHEPAPPVLFAGPLGAEPGRLSDLPERGPWHDRLIARRAFALRRLRKRLVLLAVLGLPLAFGLLIWAWLERGKTAVPVAPPLSARLADEAERLSREGDPEGALAAARTALAASPLPARAASLDAIMRRCAASLIEREEKKAARASFPPLELIARFPSSSSAHSALVRMVRSAASMSHSKAREASAAWRETLARSSALLAQGDVLSAWGLFRSFAERFPGSVQAAYARFKAASLLERARRAAAGFYSRRRSPPEFMRYDFSSPAAFASWRAEEGEWLRRDGGLFLESVEVPPASLWCDSLRYCGISFWMRLTAAPPEGGTLSAGLKGGGSSVLVVLSEENCRLVLESAGGSRTIPFAAPKTFPCTVELAVARGLAAVHAGGLVMRAAVPFAWMIEGSPVVEASGPGCRVYSFELGR